MVPRPILHGKRIAESTSSPSSFLQAPPRELPCPQSHTVCVQTPGEQIMASEGRQARTALLGQSYFWDHMVCEAGVFPRASGRLDLHLI